MLRENERDLSDLSQRLSFSQEQYRLFFQYIELLEKWQKRMNLVSKQDIHRLVSKHIEESLVFCTSGVLPSSGRVVDLGSGAGFPGIPIKIMNPGLFVSLVDSKKKKALFLQEAVESLALNSIQVICQRIETLKGIHGDVTVVRAVAELCTLWSWSRSVLAPQGILVVIKGGDLTSEIAVLRDRFPVQIRKVTLSDAHKDKRLILVSQIEK